MHERSRFWIALAAVCAGVAASWWRLHIGVDFSDEAYYVALVYRFHLGDRPFLDELHLVQTAALITWPLVGSFCDLTGGSDGIVLFTRRLFLVLNLGVAASAFLALRRRIPGPEAAVVSLLAAVLIPFAIPNLSYNTLGAGFFTIGIFLALSAVFGGPVRTLFAAAGLAHGLAILAYPPLLAPIGIFALLAPRLLPTGRVRAFAGYAAAGAGVGAALLAVAGFDGLARTAAFMRIFYVPEPGKLGRLLAQLASSQRGAGPALLAVALVWWRGARWPALALVLLPLLPLLCAWPLRDEPLWRSPLLLLASYGLFAPLLWLLVPRCGYARPLLVAAWIPSVCAGLVFAWSASRGFLNAGLGFVPAALATSALLQEALRDAARRLGRPLVGLVPLAAALLAPALLVSYQRGTYLGGTVAAPRTEVTWGPFRGLRAQESKERFLRSLRDDLRPFAGGGERILFYDHFPAGYLLTTRRPATPSLYLCHELTRAADPDFCAAHYRAQATDRSVAVMIPGTRVLGTRLLVPEYPADARLDTFVRERHHRVFDRYDAQGQPLYEVFTGPPADDRAH